LTSTPSPARARRTSSEPRVFCTSSTASRPVRHGGIPAHRTTTTSGIDTVSAVLRERRLRQQARRPFDGVVELDYRNAEKDRIDRSGTLDEDTGGSLLYRDARVLGTWAGLRAPHRGPDPVAEHLIRLPGGADGLQRRASTYLFLALSPPRRNRSNRGTAEHRAHIAALEPPLLRERRDASARRSDVWPPSEIGMSAATGVMRMRAARAGAMPGDARRAGPWPAMARLRSSSPTLGSPRDREADGERPRHRGTPRPSPVETQDEVVRASLFRVSGPGARALRRASLAPPAAAAAARTLAFSTGRNPSL